jgi:hypothetical protein
MVASFPKAGLALVAFQAVLIVSLCYSLYHKRAVLAACHANFERVQRTQAQVAATEAQLDRQEAELAAAEARSNARQ